MSADKNGNLGPDRESKTDFLTCTVDQFEDLVGKAAVDRILQKAEVFKGARIAHVNSSLYGGGVAEILDSLTLLMSSAGLRAEWKVIQGDPDYFSITKKMHNALQGDEINLSKLKKTIYEGVIRKNSLRTDLENFDMVFIHDPQPLPLVEHFQKKCPWIWRCHLDLSSPNREVWEYLRPFIDRYNAVIISGEDYRQELTVPQLVFYPAINPFSIKNREMSEEEVEERLEHYEIPTDLPIVCQISRFDHWKDPAGVIQAFRIARKKVDATLVLLGNFAADDPEGETLYRSLLDQREDRIVIMSKDDTALVNALQRASAVVLQKSIREGFGLTVAEAMFKGTPVIGGDVGGIRYQIHDGENGFLVSSVEETADCIVRILKDGDLRRKMGEKAAWTVRERFLMTRLFEQYLDLLDSFETSFRYTGNS